MSLLNLKCVKLTGMVFIGVMFLLFFVTSDHYKDNLTQLDLTQNIDYQDKQHLHEQTPKSVDGKNVRKMYFKSKKKLYG